VTIIVDTGILLAVANRTDRWHTRAVEVLIAHRHEMVVPAPVVIETAWLLARELGNTAEAGFVGAAGRGEFRIVDLTAVDYQRASEILATRADNNFGLVDACVMAIAERHHATTIATVNPRDFRIVRPAHCDAYTLIP
jgi:predicted nucleic acid-binding protein